MAAKSRHHWTCMRAMLSALHSAHRASLLLKRFKQMPERQEQENMFDLPPASMAVAIIFQGAPVKQSVVDVLDLVFEISSFQQQAESVLRGK
jgi:hypothetical protein